MSAELEGIQVDYRKIDERIAELEAENTILKTKLDSVNDYIEFNGSEIDRLKEEMNKIDLDHQGAYHEMASLCRELKDAENVERLICDLSFNIDTSVKQLTNLCK